MITSILITAAVCVAAVMGFSKLLYKKAFHLRDDWKQFYKWFSTWLTAAGTSLGAFVVEAPEKANALWMQLPDEVRTRLPENCLLYIPLGLFIAAQIVKAFKQVTHEES